MRLRLALADDLAQQRLESLHVIVLEHAHICARETDTETDRGVIQLVRDDRNRRIY